MKKLIIPLILLNIFIYSQDSKNQIIFYNYCPFECCQFGKWIVKESIDVYPNEDDTSNVIFKLNNNDTIYAQTGNLHFIQIGKVIVTKPIYSFILGDTIFIYNCQEGEILVKHDNTEEYVNIFWPVFDNEKEATEENYQKEIIRREYSGKMIKRPKTVWWVKIKLKNQQGWIKLENKTPYCFSIEEKILGMDGCG
ncbi:MAG: hypothetical protein P8Y70_20025 [Candidatus Lokiarchaeota archaeon]